MPRWYTILRDLSVTILLNISVSVRSSKYLSSVYLLFTHPPLRRWSGLAVVRRSKTPPVHHPPHHRSGPPWRRSWRRTTAGGSGKRPHPRSSMRRPATRPSTCAVASWRSTWNRRFLMEILVRLRAFLERLELQQLPAHFLCRSGSLSCSCCCA